MKSECGETRFKVMNTPVGRRRATKTATESQQRYQTLFNAMAEGFALHEIICDEKGEPCDYRFLDINSAFEQLTGLKRAAIIGKCLSEVLPNEDPHWIKIYGEVALSGKPVQFENYSPALERYYQVFAYRPAPLQFAVLFMEITEHKRMEEILRQSEEKYRTLFVTMIQGVVYWNHEGRIIAANPAAERIMGLTLDQMQAVAAKDSQWRTIHEDGTDFLNADYPSIVALRTGRSSERTIMGFYNSRTATRRWISVNAIPLFRPGEAQPYQVYATYEDITDLKLAEEKLRNLSLSDDLTGLYNRRGFLTLAEQQLKLAHRMKRGLLLIFADLDGMKQINDTLGHPVGDLALIETAHLIREVFRESDITARLSGDEFVILALDVPKGSANNIVARMLENLKNRNSKRDRPYHLSISLGMAYYNPENPRTISELLTEADALMYQQKRNKNDLLNV